jgi:hypothetical protein
VHLSRRIAITGSVVVIAVLIPAAVAVAAPTHPPDPASTRVALPRPDGPTWATARAIARHQVASFGPVRPTAPAAAVAAATPLPDSTPLPDPASAARAIAGDRAQSFRAWRPIAPSVASTRVAPSRPDGPTWAAALVAGTLAAAVAAGLVAGRRTVRVRAD